MLKPAKKKKGKPIVWTTQDFILLLLVVATFTMGICTEMIVDELAKTRKYEAELAEWEVTTITDRMDELDIQYIEKLELSPSGTMFIPLTSEDI